jgi:hypothetical protein
MVVSHSCSTQEKWQIENLHRFLKTNVTTKKDPYPLPFTNEVLNTVAWYKGYFFLNRYLGYHQISIAPENRYKTTFLIDYGAFIWKVMLFEVKNEPPTYHKVVTKSF